MSTQTTQKRSPDQMVSPGSTGKHWENNDGVKAMTPRNIPRNLTDPVVNDKTRLTAVMIDLMQWEHIAEAHYMMDRGDSPTLIYRFINKHGFTCSPNTVSDYMTIRRRALVSGISMERLIAMSSRKPIVLDKDAMNMLSLSTETTTLKNDLDALELVIQKGYDYLRTSDDPVDPKLMMAAIKLKHDMTGGMTGGYSQHGIAELALIERNKSNMLMQHMLKYIPAELHSQLIEELQQLEEQYYMNTPYYEQYLRSRTDLTEAQIQSKLSIQDVLESQGLKAAEQHLFDTRAQSVLAKDPDVRMVEAFISEDGASSNPGSGALAITNFVQHMEHGYDVTEESYVRASAAAEGIKLRGTLKPRWQVAKRKWEEQHPQFMASRNQGK